MSKAPSTPAGLETYALPVAASLRCSLAPESGVEELAENSVPEIDAVPAPENTGETVKGKIRTRIDARIFTAGLFVRIARTSIGNRSAFRALRPAIVGNSRDARDRESSETCVGALL